MDGRPAGESDCESDDYFMDNEAPGPPPALRSRPINNLIPKQNVMQREVDLDDLRIAAMKGNITKIKLYVEGGVSVDQALRNGWIALMYAASGGKWEAVQLLLELKSNPNFHKELFTPLMAACASSQESEDNLVRCVKLLLENGANINAAERHKVTSLMFACKEKKLKIVETLLEGGADINCQDNHKWTALMWAADKGSGAIVRKLLECGADRNILSTSGQKAADIAMIAGHKDMAALLEKGLASLDCEPVPPVKEPVEITELDTVLMGLDLNELIPVFHEHHMNYDSFLMLDEKDLDLMNISQVGYRSRILGAVKEIHTKEWERDSLPAIQYSKFLSCPEATSLVGNLALHGRYMLASVAYLRDQIQRKPRILQLGMETASVHSLSAQTQYALKQVSELQQQLKYLKKYLDKVQDKSEFVPADLITEKNLSAASPQSLTRLAVLSVVVVTGSVAFWRGWCNPPSQQSTVLLV